jgi:competence protein ComEA
MEISPEQKKMLTLFLVVLIIGTIVSFLRIQVNNAQLNKVLPEPTVTNKTNDVEKLTETPSNNSGKIVIHISGAVLAPGFYQLSEGARLYEAVEAAYGFALEADIDQINLAQVIKDGEKVVIPVKKNKFAISVTATTGNYPVRNGNLNLNSCTAKDLDDLPGIGAATAKKIIDLRNQLGRFSSLEQLKPLKLKKQILETLKTQAVI